MNLWFVLTQREYFLCVCCACTDWDLSVGVRSGLMGMNKMDENGDGYDRWWVLQMVSWVKLDMVSMDDVESDGYEDEKKWSVVSVVSCMGLCLHENRRMTS